MSAVDSKNCESSRSSLRVTHHARARFTRRFPGREIEQVFDQARLRLTRNDFKLLRKFCPGHSHLATPASQEYWYRKTRDGIVFVMAHPARIITVFKLRSRSN